MGTFELNGPKDVKLCGDKMNKDQAGTITQIIASVPVFKVFMDCFRSNFKLK